MLKKTPTVIQTSKIKDCKSEKNTLALIVTVSLYIMLVTISISCSYRITK